MCSCSARSSACASGAPACGSSCATPRAPCRARCGATPSRSCACPPGALSDGGQVVVAGGPDYYAGSRTASPSFSFAVSGLRLAGEGDLLAQVEVLRRTLAAEGLFEPQKRLARPALPRCIGVVTGESGKARDDVLAGLRRRGWAGRVVWAFAPVQDRHAAPAITRALQDLAAVEEVEVVVVARGGGSMADLFAFCDETLCRTVALLRVPVIASVGHHTDRTLIDDVAAASCSTPTHAAETAVPLHCGEARAAVAARAGRLAVHARRAVIERARHLAHLSRAPGEHVARERRALHQTLREARASATRRVRDERAATRARALGPGPPRGRGRRPRARRPPHGARRLHARAGRPRPRARGRARLRRRRRPPRQRAHERRGGPRRARRPPALRRRRRRCEDRRRWLRARPRRRPTRPPPRAWRRSSSAWTPARPACARRSTSSARAAAWSSSAPAELDAVGKGLEELRLEELVARLEQ